MGHLTTNNATPFDDGQNEQHPLDKQLAEANEVINFLSHLLACCTAEFGAIATLAHPEQVPHKTDNLADLRTHIWNYQQRAEHALAQINKSIEFHEIDIPEDQL